ncbi:MAG: helix-turn-helix domain-containing protein [Myxococcales bacterium]|nr:helix-turn-helix domain-containing protein [Myxococcales bacterium]MCB9649404.1 helix-turn-helix domain-containing protein [Deltaproteobacteria bacterium]
MEHLQPLGDAVRRARHAEGLTIRDLAERSGLSPRFLSDLEHGKGNISIARLVEVGRALRVPVSALVAPLDSQAAPRQALALVGLRGAGKSSLGRAAARLLGRPFVELDERVEAEAGLPLSQIFEIHGEDYYRRLERRTLVSILDEAGRGGSKGPILATGGGIVTDPQSWGLLRMRCHTVWLEAQPEDHYQRVMEQGDLRPMENRPSAMVELRALLAARAPLYAQADARIQTSELGFEGALAALQTLCEQPEALG